VYDAEGFVAAAACMQGVNVVLMTSAVIEERNTLVGLSSIVKGALNIPGINRKHRMRVITGTATFFHVSRDDSPVSAHGDIDSCTPQRDIQVGDWYVVEYGGMLFPREVVQLGDGAEYQVSVMEHAGRNWKWPATRDMVYYPRERMINRLDKPDIANNRGHFKFSVPF